MPCKLNRAVGLFKPSSRAPELRDPALSHDDPTKGADMGAPTPYKYPRDVTRKGILDLLTRAHVGQRPPANG